MQEVMRGHKEALLSVCLRSLCKLKGGAGNVTERRLLSALSHASCAVNLTRRRARLTQAAPPVVNQLRCSDTVADKEVGKP